jgi:hypothetical protein
MGSSGLRFFKEGGDYLFDNSAPFLLLLRLINNIN